MLTERQKDVVQCFARGKSGWVTAQILGVSENTVRFHAKAAMHRASVSTITHLCSVAISEGWIAPVYLNDAGVPEKKS